jgi:cyclophilin family peptidyl-prolyl cis-trans isomerase/plastocyanin
MSILVRLIVVLVLVLSYLHPGPASSQELRFQQGDHAVVTVNVSRLRSEPTFASEMVMALESGDEVEIAGSSPESGGGVLWWEVETVAQPVTSGWIQDAHIDPIAGAPETASETASDQCWPSGVESKSEDGSPTWSQAPQMEIDPEQRYIATISTAAGDIVIELDVEHAPIAVNNFYCLASDGYYDGTEFHRVAPGFFIQGGDPTGTGEGTPGYTFENEATTGEYPPGSVAMANAAPDENGSQFFIAIDDLTGLIPDDYPVFGQVTSGMDVVQEIGAGQVEANDSGEISAPIDPVTIESIEVREVGTTIGPPIPAEGPKIGTPEAAAATPEAGPAEPETITVVSKDIFFEPAEITIEPFTPTTIVLPNEGAAAHNFSIDELGIDVDIAAGATEEVTIFAPPGTYEYYCNVPGHKEAGMVGTLVVSSDGAAVEAGQQEAPDALGNCEELEAYEADFDAAVGQAMMENPEVLALFLKFGFGEVDPATVMSELTPEEFALMGAFFADAGDALESIEPPSVADAWHQNQIEMLRLLAQFFEDIGSEGSLFAGIQSAGEIERLETEGAAALEEVASVCPEFRTWAEEEGL